MKEHRQIFPWGLNQRRSDDIDTFSMSTAQNFTPSPLLPVRIWQYQRRVVLNLEVK